MDLGDVKSEMCSPCECMGTIKYIHVACLKEWIKEKKSIKCELCGTSYSNKWKMWAFKNKVIASDVKKLSYKEIFMIILKSIYVVYFQIILIFIL